MKASKFDQKFDNGEDVSEFLDFSNDFPTSAKSSLSSLKIEERIAALHLGFTGEYATNWKKFWLNLSSKEGQAKFKKKNIVNLNSLCYQTHIV